MEVYVCPKCGQSFLANPLHRFCRRCYIMFVVKDVEANEYLCPVCRQSFTSLYTLRHHFNTSPRCGGEIGW